jgi:hypothetical protein
LIGRYEDEKQKIRYLFHLKCADDTEILHGSKQFIHISKEGDPSQIFEADIVAEEDEVKEPKIGWAKSRARKLLYKDVKEGNVALDQTHNGCQRKIPRMEYWRSIRKRTILRIIR